MVVRCLCVWLVGECVFVWACGGVVGFVCFCMFAFVCFVCASVSLCVFCLCLCVCLRACVCACAFISSVFVYFLYFVCYISFNKKKHQVYEIHISIHFLKKPLYSIKSHTEYESQAK